LKLTLGLLGGCSGEILVFGFSPEEARRRRLIGYVPQRNSAELRFQLTARPAVRLGATVGLPAGNLLWREQRGVVARSMRLVGAGDLADQQVGSLSGGQLQRVLIARALACRPRLLLLDEPTVGIDVAGQQQFADLLKHLHDDLKLTVMVVSHDIRTVASGC